MYDPALQYQMRWPDTLECCELPRRWWTSLPAAYRVEPTAWLICSGAIGGIPCRATLYYAELELAVGLGAAGGDGVVYGFRSDPTWAKRCGSGLDPDLLLHLLAIKEARRG